MHTMPIPYKNAQKLVIKHFLQNYKKYGNKDWRQSYKKYGNKNALRVE